MIYNQILKQTNTTGTTNGAKSIYTSGAVEFTLAFNGIHFAQYTCNITELLVVMQNFIFISFYRNTILFFFLNNILFFSNCFSFFEMLFRFIEILFCFIEKLFSLNEILLRYSGTLPPLNTTYYFISTNVYLPLIVHNFVLLKYYLPLIAHRMF